jgi:regulator of protease activity HflC (stomatin/prohibitin superfamily)
MSLPAPEIISEIPLDTDEFIKAIEDAIKAEQSKSGKTFEESKAEQEEEEAEKLKALAEAEKANRKKKELDEVLNEITDFIKENKGNMDVVKPLLAKSKELGFANPTQIDNIKDAKAVAALIG